MEDLSGKVQELEGAHRVDVQKMALLEAQKSQLTCEKEDALTVSNRAMASMFTSVDDVCKKFWLLSLGFNDHRKSVYGEISKQKSIFIILKVTHRSV